MPAVLTVWNLLLFRRPGAPSAGAPMPHVSVLIPARDEERMIGDAVRAALMNERVEVEVVVLDDGSTDGTARVVRGLSLQDRRVRLHTAPPLPEGWSGKHHACHILSQLASHDLLVWIDADVRLRPDALARAAALLRREHAGLVTGLPRQRTVTLAEQLIVPLFHLVVLGYLPLGVTQRSMSSRLAVGCGQFIMADREAYARTDGHAAVKASLFDGLALPRAFRKAGQRTIFFDATALATGRMFHAADEVWVGTARWALEGMARGPLTLLIWTVLLAGAFILPTALALLWAGGALGSMAPQTQTLVLVSVVISYATSLLLMARFRQPWIAGLLRPAGVAILLAIHWYALVARLTGRAAEWKGGLYTTGSAAPADDAKAPGA